MRGGTVGLIVGARGLAAGAFPPDWQAAVEISGRAVLFIILVVAVWARLAESHFGSRMAIVIFNAAFLIPALRDDGVVLGLAFVATTMSIQIAAYVLTKRLWLPLGFALVLGLVTVGFELGILEVVLAYAVAALMIYLAVRQDRLIPARSK